MRLTTMLKNLDSLGEQTINRIATAALSSQMKESESFSVNVKVDPQELSQGIVSAFAMEGKNVVTSKGFRATDFSLLIENISVHPFKALMGNVQLRQPVLGNALLGVSTADVNDALYRQLQVSTHNGCVVNDLSCDFTTPNLLSVQMVVGHKDTNVTQDLMLEFTVGYDVHRKAIAFQNVGRSDSDEKFDVLCESLQDTLLELLNLNSLMFSGLEFSVKNLRITDGNLELMAIAKITSFPKAI
ncbi:hypothetical protein Lepto7376_2728 [[Leptolyngbya] sp. PCC 7376]|uniref:LmeA family phospholipid-binding protein n=1 Tax=[Leptolyngbya] sp. PCC 7376 TaxID=111781 RepID=UPI00029EE436|nr:DUF2993 domain-containing protein [[Leptolyngbya] sp. PCC 7376]AFY38991.1 hypothetical protein Lepto7376_2728 [[Leptolyngbya] sp. PCC 7376]